jgi:hypothetical protein
VRGVARREADQECVEKKVTVARVRDGVGISVE